MRPGETASSDAKVAKSFVGEFRKIVATEDYLLQQVFNCDETGVPKRTYITAEKEVMPGHNPMTDRFTPFVPLLAVTCLSFRESTCL